jgi:cytochrome c nitrite reductase small subunit
LSEEKNKAIMKWIFPHKLVMPFVILCGIAIGSLIYLIYISRVTSYLSHDPAACANCHIMAPYYQSWQKSSHQPWTNCNDCHVPQDNPIKGYSFKAKDGLYHAAIFTLRMEPQVIRPRESSYAAIMKNCIRCHTQLNQEFVKTAMVDYSKVVAGEEKACWHCHREVPHGKISNLAMSPNAIVPLPETPVPNWLKTLMK